MGHPKFSFGMTHVDPPGFSSLKREPGINRVISPPAVTPTPDGMACHSASPPPQGGDMLYITPFPIDLGRGEAQGGWVHSMTHPNIKFGMSHIIVDLILWDPAVFERGAQDPLERVRGEDVSKY